MPVPKTILLTSGGSGGHLFPAEALAEELQTRGHRVVFVTDKRGQRFQGENKFENHCILSATLMPGLLSKISAVFAMGAGIAQAFWIVMRRKPKVVVGFGGYPAFPASFVAAKTSVPLILHEQNAVLGRANQWLAKDADKIALSLSNDDNLHEKAIVTGNPVRRTILDAQDRPYDTPSTEGPFRIFVTGGSQGSLVFDEILPAALALLPENLRQRVQLVQQTRTRDMGVLEKSYTDLGVQARLSAFFSGVADQLAGCHLFIGRSGASTVAEIGVIGRPAIFVPYPHHEDMQQKVNAEVISSAGGGWVLMQDEFTPEVVAARLEELMAAPDLLVQTAAAAKTCGQPEAVKNLADLVESFLKTEAASDMRPFDQKHMRKVA